MGVFTLLVVTLWWYIPRPWPFFNFPVVVHLVLTDPELMVLDAAAAQAAGNSDAQTLVPRTQAVRKEEDLPETVKDAATLWNILTGLNTAPLNQGLHPTITLPAVGDNVPQATSPVKPALAHKLAQLVHSKLKAEEIAKNVGTPIANAAKQGIEALADTSAALLANEMSGNLNALLQIVKAFNFDPDARRGVPKASTQLGVEFLKKAAAKGDNGLIDLLSLLMGARRPDGSPVYEFSEEGLAPDEKLLAERVRLPMDQLAVGHPFNSPEYAGLVPAIMERRKEHRFKSLTIVKRMEQVHLEAEAQARVAANKGDWPTAAKAAMLCSQLTGLYHNHIKPLVQTLGAEGTEELFKPSSSLLPGGIMDAAALSNLVALVNQDHPAHEAIKTALEKMGVVFRAQPKDADTGVGGKRPKTAVLSKGAGAGSSSPNAPVFCTACGRNHHGRCRVIANLLARLSASRDDPQGAANKGHNTHKPKGKQ